MQKSFRSFRKHYGPRYFYNNWQLYLLLGLVMAYYFLFAYKPMYGLIMAFQDFNPVKGFARSKWVGFENFERLFNGPYFWQILRNTITLSLYGMIASFPFPIIFALMVHILPQERIKKPIQTIAYAPHFISTVVIVGMLKLFTSPSSGFINTLIVMLGGEPINFFAKASWFPHLYVWSGIWQSTGWSAVIYIAALSGVDQEQHEAAMIDGATRMKRVWHIDIPSIMPTIIILSIMSFANLVGVGFEKAYLMQTDLNLSTSEVISTYSYKMGMEEAEYSFSAAISMFNSIITFTLLVLFNAISKRVSEISLF